MKEKKDIKIEHLKPTEWGWMVSYPGTFYAPNDVDIGAFTYIQAVAGVTIGHNVQIGSHCAIYSRNTIDKTIGPVDIEDDVCIGSHSVIFPNVRIGKGAKIVQGVL